MFRKEPSIFLNIFIRNQKRIKTKLKKLYIKRI